MERENNNRLPIAYSLARTIRSGHDELSGEGCWCPKAVDIDNGSRMSRNECLDGSVSVGGERKMQANCMSDNTWRKSLSGINVHFDGRRRGGRRTADGVPLDSGCAVSTKFVSHSFEAQGRRGYFACSSNL